jgi:hypothetical protein
MITPYRIAHFRNRQPRTLKLFYFLNRTRRMHGMALTCNIDACGKRVRLLNGIILAAFGLGTALLWAIRGGSFWLWAASAFLLIVGGFCIFEARAGWCALRAMGIKTKL